MEDPNEFGMREGYIPRTKTSCPYHGSAMTHPSRAEAAEREAILDQACKDRPLGNGKSLPLNRLLADYGREEFPIGGQRAVSHKLDHASRCEQCRALQL